LHPRHDHRLDKLPVFQSGLQDKSKSLGRMLSPIRNRLGLGRQLHLQLP